ncbi:type I-E CRISPR-associated endoribonuclease Cas2e [Streptomyces sp. NPDC101490]|uniref:type I-E CRISPR-associated endoribonuclease Cas2e n=1 Tax=Streptomyces sp. NPDC101490 TaxID=3366143 RepID=UPI00382E3753
MTVIVLTNCPAPLRGFLTRWLLEISAGVFIGNPSARIRDILWHEIQQYADQGRAILAHTANNEQGYTFRTFDHSWRPIDHDGLTLIHRPVHREKSTADSPTSKTGWSKASKRRRFAR